MTRLLSILIVALLSASTTQALERFDFEQKYFIEFGPEVKDHSLVKVNGLYHLFYLRGNPAVNVGHATSTDFTNWEIQPPILDVVPGEWDGRAIWAPQVIEYNGGYLMFYTGLNDAFAQQTGIAYSTDLYQWHRIPWPVYNPDPSWALWDVNAWSHGRDPYVLEYQGQYLLLNTAKTLTDKGAIACASSNDLFTWTDDGPLYTHTNWHVLESVQCIQRNNLWHLFYTEETVGGTYHMASPDLFSGWDPATGGLLDFGAAPEVNEFDPGQYIFSRHSVYNDGHGMIQYVLRFDELGWSGDTPYVKKPWPLLNDWTRDWGTAFVYSPTFLNNPYVRGEDVDPNFQGDSWLSSKERYQGPLGIGNPGDDWGEGATGLLHSRTFKITGNSISLLVGGMNSPDIYVALVDAGTGEYLFSETGKDTETMDRRYWDVIPYKGRMVYLEILDNSTTGHISVDDIVEGGDILNYYNGEADGSRKNNLGLASHPIEQVSTTLEQNRPNPFNPTTEISYNLATTGHVAIDIFDVSGKRIRRLVNEAQPAGTHATTWDATDEFYQRVSSGIYFYRLVVDDRVVATRKMILLK